MISDDLYALADRLSINALAGIPLPASLCACMAHALMEHARAAKILETLPFNVTAALVEEVPEGALVRAVEASKTRAWPGDLLPPEAGSKP
jgi:hypothetical protein